MGDKARWHGFLNRQSDDEQAAAWYWLLDQTERYPVTLSLPPLREQPPTNQPTRFVTWHLLTENGTGGLGPRPTGIEIYDGLHYTTVPLVAGPADVLTLRVWLLARQHTGAILAGWGFGRSSAHVLLRSYAPQLVASGYQLKPIADGADIKALIVSHDRHAWTMGDVQAITGLKSYDQSQFLAAFDAGGEDETRTIVRLWRALHAFQRVLLDDFGVPARLTFGSAAIAAFRTAWDSRHWLWRPQPELVSLCRSGGGYRGGYVYAQRWSGKAWKIDCNKLYLYALSQGIPAGAALGHCVANGQEREGIYVCQVQGPGMLPVYLSVWAGNSAGWIRRQWCGDSCLCLLPTAEFDGLRALGYRVHPGHGYMFLRSVPTRGYVARISSLLNIHPRGSPGHAVAKLMGNATYGKLAENPRRVEVAYSAERPASDWHPYVTDRGEDVDDLWSHVATSYRAHQHVDVAAVITARARSHLYSALAAVLSAGLNVVQVDTDGFLVDGDPSGLLDFDPDRIGAWRIVEAAQRTDVAGARFYRIGDSVRNAGSPAVEPGAAEVVAAGGTWTVAGKTLAPPWAGGAMYRPITKVLR